MTDFSGNKEQGGVVCSVYERFVVRASRPSVETPLSCNEHPVFNNIPNVPQEQNGFFNRVFTKEGDIFKECQIDWEPGRNLS